MCCPRGFRFHTVAKPHCQAPSRKPEQVFNPTESSTPVQLHTTDRLRLHPHPRSHSHLPNPHHQDKLRWLLPVYAPDKSPAFHENHPAAQIKKGPHRHPTICLPLPPNAQWRWSVITGTGAAVRCLLALPLSPPPRSACLTCCPSPPTTSRPTGFGRATTGVGPK